MYNTVICIFIIELKFNTSVSDSINNAGSYQFWSNVGTFLLIFFIFINLFVMDNKIIYTYLPINLILKYAIFEFSTWLQNRDRYIWWEWKPIKDSCSYIFFILSYNKSKSLTYTHTYIHNNSVTIIALFIFCQRRCLKLHRLYLGMRTKLYVNCVF